MILVAHLVTVFLSISMTTLTFVSPSSSRLKVTHALIALTLISGTALVVATHAAMLSSCITGLIYSGLSIFGTFAARLRLNASVAADE